MAKMIAPLVAIWWLSDTATFNPLVPTAAALNADITSSKAYRISRALAAGYTLNPTDSDTDSSLGAEDSSSAESRGNANYEATMQFFKEKSPLVNTTSAYLKAWTLFKTKGVHGTLVRRIGYAASVAPAATQEVDIFTVVTDRIRIIQSDSNGPIQFEVPFGMDGYMNINESLA